ncbi:hypothetical protein SERIO_v1c04180 [Spiroplasma eriocheiris]|uniref:Uncharacterized protein n=2 Tax=Spiroplasma eriocheiris TaxID=315358 RepID=A0A0H3XM81_9MOLU|nr:putative lipoprotein [Spiroplasma eriocheiris CCTCC M 207170]AKM53997.1 hypothetical protein SERIO_v1c04180 [Spiroplasma eriocheiris]
MFGFIVMSGTAFLTAFLSSQIVFLILTIFCSLFLLGGLPYSLFKEKTNWITINFEGKGLKTISQVKEIINFKNYLDTKQMKYPNITKKIYDFYNSLSDAELQNPAAEDVTMKRIDLYRSLGLTESKDFVLKGIVNYWKDNPDIMNGVEIDLSFDNYFKDLTSLQQSRSSSVYIKELLEIADYYETTYNLNQFIDLESPKCCGLLTYNDSSLVLKLDDGSTFDSNKINGEVYNEIYKSFMSGSKVYRFNAELQREFLKVYNNPLYFIIRNLEDIIYNAVYDYNTFKTSQVSLDESFKKYQSIIGIYQAISYFNVIEHWNRIWSSMVGYYGNFWFYPFSNFSPDFDNQNNMLISYQDFELILNNKNQLDVENLHPFQDDYLIEIVYLILAGLLTIGAFMIITRKNISN